MFGLPELLVTGKSTEMYEVKANSSVMMGELFVKLFPKINY